MLVSSFLNLFSQRAHAEGQKRDTLMGRFDQQDSKIG